MTTVCLFTCVGFVLAPPTEASSYFSHYSYNSHLKHTHIHAFNPSFFFVACDGPSPVTHTHQCYCFYCGEKPCVPNNRWRLEATLISSKQKTTCSSPFFQILFLLISFYLSCPFIPLAAFLYFFLLFTLSLPPLPLPSCFFPEIEPPSSFTSILLYTPHSSFFILFCPVRLSLLRRITATQQSSLISRVIVTSLFSLHFPLPSCLHSSWLFYSSLLLFCFLHLIIPTLFFDPSTFPSVLSVAPICILKIQKESWNSESPSKGHSINIKRCTKSLYVVFFVCCKSKTHLLHRINRVCVQGDN